MPDALDKAASLRRVFEDIRRTRMHDVPILNEALGVEVVGMREWRGHWLCVLVTPWCINLMLLPGEEGADAFAAQPPGSSVGHVFPAGRFEFIAGEEDGLGRFQMCSLFSPVFEFDAHETAVLTAKAALEALFEADNAEETGLEEQVMGGLARGETPDVLRPIMPGPVADAQTDEGEEDGPRRSGFTRREIVTGLAAAPGETDG